MGEVWPTKWLDAGGLETEMQGLRANLGLVVKAGRLAGEVLADLEQQCRDGAGQELVSLDLQHVVTMANMWTNLGVAPLDDLMTTALRLDPF